MITLYMDMKFLSAYLNGQPSDTFSQDYLHWLSFYRFLMENEYYEVITLNKGKLIQLHDFKLLLSSLRNPQNRESFFKDIESQSSEAYHLNLHYDYKSNLKNPHSLIFFEVQQKTLLLLRKHGFLFLSSNTFLDIWSKFQSNQSFTVEPEFKERKGNPFALKQWSDISPFVLPCNDICIIDPYLAIDLKQVKANLFPLLEVLLDKQSHITELTLLYSSREIKSPKGYISTQLEPKVLKEAIEFFLRTFFPHQVRIRVIRTDAYKQLHDRLVITNYFSIDSGRSFSFFRTRRKSIPNSVMAIHKTTVRLTYLVKSIHRNSILKMLDLVGKLIQETPPFTGDTQLKTGKNKSRLLP